MPPKVKSDDKEIKTIIEEASNISAGKAVDAVIEKLKTSGEGKISKILNNGSPTDLEEQKRKERVQLEKEKENLQKELEQSEVYCPTCSRGEHKHKLKSLGEGKMGCIGDDCKTEYALIPTNAEYKCRGCGSPKAKPSDEHVDDSCPFCGNQNFDKHDWNKIKERFSKNIKK